jgi:hypothetical protein
MNIGWYQRESYARIREIMVDPYRFPQDYESWLETAVNGVQKLNGMGWKVVMVDIEPEEFIAWCQERGIKADNQARLEFADTRSLDVTDKHWISHLQKTAEPIDVQVCN